MIQLVKKHYLTRKTKTSYSGKWENTMLTKNTKPNPTLTFLAVDIFYSFFFLLWVSSLQLSYQESSLISFYHNTNYIKSNKESMTIKGKNDKIKIPFSHRKKLR